MAYKKVFTSAERKEYLNGLSAARSDYAWCQGDKQKIKSCVDTRKRMLELCKKRSDNLGISFQKGYLQHFYNKVNRK